MQESYCNSKQLITKDKAITIDQIISLALDLSATDIHLEVDKPIYIRAAKGLESISRICSTDMLSEVLQKCEVTDDGWQSVDSAFTSNGIRIRAHIYRANHKVCGTLRLLCHANLSLDASKDSDVLKSICEYHDGLVLVTGPTGSGKSYTLACCIEYINKTMNKHIITLEDPVEYEFVPSHSIIHQRQLGIDVDSMAHGIRDALREDPDVIMVGELRDRDTLEAALHAAETGHLVLATMHTQRAVMAVHRMISLFPGEQQDEVRSQVSQVLRAVICQRLLRWETSFITIRDILLNTNAVANLIRNRKEPQIVSIQETQAPMKTLEMAVRDVKTQYGSAQQLHALLEQQLS